jgi:hypothetical protein
MNTVTTQSYTHTLTRWHKVAERLTKEFNELSKSVKNGLTNTFVTEYLGEQQEKRLTQLRDNCLTQLDRAMLIQDVVVAIRQALSAANERIGISRELAEYDKRVKRANLLTSIIQAQVPELISISELKEVKNPARSDDYSNRGKTRIAVGLLEGEQLSALRERTAAETAAMYSQADHVAELNKAQLTLELPVEVATIAGL